MVQQQDVNDALVYLATSAVTYSIKYNPRGLEDVTYPMWSHIMAGASIPNITYPAPQFKIYVSARDVTESISTARLAVTTADSTARGVTTDFALLLPFFKNGGLLTPETRAAITSSRNWDPQEWFSFVHRVKLAYIMLPQIAEVKQPVTRSAASLFHYLKCISGWIQMARSQAIKQAWCLFSSTRFADQNKITLRVGANEWWSWCTLTRAEVGHMRGGALFHITRNMKKDNMVWDNERGDFDYGVAIRDLPQDRDEISGRYESVKETARQMDRRVQEAEELARKQADQRRDARALERLKRYDDDDAEDDRTPEEEYEDLRDMKEEVYGNQEIHRFTELARTYLPKFDTWELAVQFNKLEDEDDETIIRRFKNARWSPVTRIGSEISNIWEGAIKRDLYAFTQKEMEKIQKEEEERKKQDAEARAVQVLAPGQQVPGQQAPAQPVPGQQAPVQPAPGQPAPAQRAPTRRAPVRQAATRQAAADPGPSQRVPDNAPVQRAQADQTHQSSDEGDDDDDDDYEEEDSGEYADQRDDTYHPDDDEDEDDSE